jgi:hypothetical protein
MIQIPTVHKLYGMSSNIPGTYRCDGKNFRGSVGTIAWIGRDLIKRGNERKERAPEKNMKQDGNSN